MEKESEKILTNFRERIISLAGLKFALLKLNACERAAKISAALAHSILVLVLGLFAILFIFFALGFFLSELTGRLSLGFLIVSLIYLIILFIVYYRKKQVRLAIANLIVGSILDEDEEEKTKEEKLKQAIHEEEKQPDDSTGETPSKTE
ncbi:MAG: phage holin family protein [Oscillibacter sp.]|nr:phage holin family protein [Oscillibacter sp.]